MKATICCLFVTLASTALAHDPHTHQINEKVGDAKNKGGGLCCDGHDYTIADAWERGEKGYRVFVKGAWLDVPPEAYVENIRNPYSEAIVWLYQTKSGYGVRCFKEGLAI